MLFISTTIQPILHIVDTEVGKTDKDPAQELMTDMRADMGGGGVNALSLQGPLCPQPRLRPATLRSGLFQRLKAQEKQTAESQVRITEWIPLGKAHWAAPSPRSAQMPPSSSGTVQWLRMSLGSSSSSATPI